MQAIDAEAEPVEDRGSKVLQDDVGVPHQPLERGPAVVGLEVEGDGLLVPVARQVVRRNGRVRRPHERRSPATRVVAAGGGLDLDDTSAEVAEHHPGVRPGERAGESRTTPPLSGPFMWRLRLIRVVATTAAVPDVRRRVLAAQHLGQVGAA